MGDKEFWRCTPRKLNALLSVHAKINGGDDDDTKPTPKGFNKKVKVGYIDDVLPLF